MHMNLEALIEAVGDQALSESWTRDECSNYCREQGFEKPVGLGRALYAWLRDEGQISLRGRALGGEKRIPETSEKSARSRTERTDNRPETPPMFGRWDQEPAPVEMGGMSRVPIPEDDVFNEPLALIKKRKREESDRTLAKAKVYGPRTVRLKHPGPIMLVHFGDPHIDNPGCDFRQLEKDVEIVARTPHAYGGNIGDTRDNWVGRLERLYAHHGMTEDEGIELARWLMHAIPWIYIVGGNHDQWKDGMRLMNYLCAPDKPGGAWARVGHMASDECKVILEWPDKMTYRINARHDHKGHSMYNKNHGLNKKALFNGWGDLFVAGHRHIWKWDHDEYPDGSVAACLRVRGYKAVDDYAIRLDCDVQKYGASIATVINPWHEHPFERVKAFQDLEEAADFLGWIRRRQVA